MSLKRPSSRRRTEPQEVQLNLVPMLDALVTMIAFLMYTMAFLSLTMIESPLPMVSSAANQAKLKDRPLQLTLTINEKDILLWSPFDLIPQTHIANHDDGTPDTLKLHEAVLAIKQKFPAEKNLVLVPKSNTSYDTIVLVLDAARNVEKTDPPIIVPSDDPKAAPAPAKTLFGDVIFGNLLGGDE